MSEMVERMARAMATVLFEDADVYWGLDPIPVAVEKFWQDYDPAARAAIKAMREPTEGMISAALDDDCRDIWTAMIDEALK